MSTGKAKYLSINSEFRLSDAIKTARTSAGLTQKELADALEKHKTQISAWERGLYSPSQELLSRISEITGIGFLYSNENLTRLPLLKDRLVAARAALGYDRGQLSEELGLESSDLESFESGDVAPSSEQLKVYRSAGINDEWLLTGQGSMLIAPAKADRRSLADRLKIALKHRNMTQSELATGIGATDSQVSLWISGEHEPRGKNRHAIASFLNVNEAWLRTGAGPMDPADDYGAAPGGEAETEVDRRMAVRSSQKDDVNRISQTIDAIASLLSVNSPRLKDNPVLVWQATELLKSLNAALRDLINEKGGGQAPDRDR